MIRNHMLALAIAAAMQPLHNVSKLTTTGFKRIAGSVGKVRSLGNKYNRKSGSKYKPHQGKQECARRLRVGSAAWYSALSFVK